MKEGLLGGEFDGHPGSPSAAVIGGLGAVVEGWKAVIRESVHGGQSWKVK
jgi:hypothetical protein